MKDKAAGSDSTKWILSQATQRLWVYTPSEGPEPAYPKGPNLLTQRAHPMPTNTHRMIQAAAVSAVASISTAQTAYLVFPIPDIPAEAVSSSLTGVSDDGVCTGVWFDEQGYPTAFTWVLDDSDPTIAGYRDEGIWWERERGDINDDEHWANSTKQLTAFHSVSVHTPAYWIPGAAQFGIGHLGGERGRLTRPQ
jgi:hypothetical protein